MTKVRSWYWANSSERDSTRASKNSHTPQDTFPSDTCIICKGSHHIKECLFVDNYYEEYDHLGQKCTRNKSRAKDSVVRDVLQELRIDTNENRKQLHQTRDEVQHLRNQLKCMRDDLDEKPQQMRKEVEKARAYTRENNTAAQNTVLQYGMYGLFPRVTKI